MMQWLYVNNKSAPDPDPKTPTPTSHPPSQLHTTHPICIFIDLLYSRNISKWQYLYSGFNYKFQIYLNNFMNNWPNALYICDFGLDSVK